MIDVSPKTAVIKLMEGAVPERLSQLRDLWTTYDPAVELVEDRKGITLNANKDRIAFDAKTKDVFWMIGFAGWKAIEIYSPLVLVSTATNQRVSDLIRDDHGLDEVERAYKERRASAQALIDTATPDSVPWPPDIPRPTNDRHGFDHDQDKVSLDLTGFALALALFHEFRHVMLDHDDCRPHDPREEELQCDVWARGFMTARLEGFARAHGHDYHEVLRKRSMGFALAALILHEITPFWDHGGNQRYFSIATRMEAILDNAPLPDNDVFWNFTAALLIGIFRQKGTPIDAAAMSAKAFTSYLIAKL